MPMCQNSALSMEAVGQSVKAFVIDKDKTPILHQEQIDFLQWVIASYRKLAHLRDEAGRIQKALEDGGVP